EAAVQRQNLESGQRMLEKESEGMANITPIEDRLQRFLELNKLATTGPLAGRRPMVGQPEFQELKQIENWLSANNFKPGQGAISNYERAMIKESGPNTLYDNKTNERIITLQLGAIQNLRD